MTQYVSTRGHAPTLGFAETTLAGLARDGGLYVPETIPFFSAADLQDLAKLSYTDLAFRIIAPFVGKDIPEADLKSLLHAAYQNFAVPDVAPLRQFGDNLYLQELFHGPTLAFKDVALQFLGQVFDYILSRRKERVTIVGATSGDTGSAAIEAFRGREHAHIVILHPHGRVSDVQRRQMTTVQAPNVFNIAVEGSFDDCQDLVKAMFKDAKFRDEMRLSAVNSINWARILAQAVYYFHATLKLGRSAAFAVPTGNFGNVYAGYLAKKMGAPIEKLIIATNRNDILHRFMESGSMEIEGVTPSNSPSMDIQVSSNFERLLFDLLDGDAEMVSDTMDIFREEKGFTLPATLMAQMRFLFTSGRRDDAATLATIKDFYEKHKYVLDPHTAVGVSVAQSYLKRNPEAPVVALATAHPAKFPDAVAAATGLVPPLPDTLGDLLQRPEKYDVLPAKLPAIQAYVRERITL